MTPFRTGRVDSTDTTRHTARVRFEELDGETSYDLPVLVQRPGDASLPPVAALVLCLMDPGSAGVGWVVGCHYSDEDAPPTDDAEKRIVSSEGGASQTLDSDGSHKLASASGKKVSINGTDHPLPKWDTFESALSTLLNDIAIGLSLGTAGSPVTQQLLGLANIQVAVGAFRARLGLADFDSAKAVNG